MPAQLPSPAHVLTLVFSAWGAGVLGVGALSRTWKEIDDGHFKVVWLVSAGLGIVAAFGYRSFLLGALLSLGAFAALYRGADRLLGAAAAVAAAAGLGLQVKGPVAGVEAYAAAAYLGTVSNAMLLGHWHLNQPLLGTKPIARLVGALWGATAAFLASSLWAAAGGVGTRLVAAITAAAFAAGTFVLTAMVHHLVRTKSIMSATGILYLEILLCFSAVFTGMVAVLTPS